MIVTSTNSTNGIQLIVFTITRNEREKNVFFFTWLALFSSFNRFYFTIHSPSTETRWSYHSGQLIFNGIWFEHIRKKLSTPWHLIEQSIRIEFFGQTICTATPFIQSCQYSFCFISPFSFVHVKSFITETDSQPIASADYSLPFAIVHAHSFD